MLKYSFLWLFLLARTEPNSNSLFESSTEPNRTRTDFLKIQSNRTELEPEKFGSIRSLISINKFFFFYRHFKYLYRHYGHVLILNLVEQREHEKRVGDEYRKLFNLLVKTYKQIQTNQKPILGHLNERDFIWFDYHEQLRTVKNITPEQFVRNMLLENVQYPIGQALKQQTVFTYIDDTTFSLQQGIFRINCIDCLDRTNNVQLTIGLVVLSMQLESLKKRNYSNNLLEQLREMWINNGDHISRIYTGTGALGQRSKVRFPMTLISQTLQIMTFVILSYSIKVIL
jgi:phosphatidylinositol-bisphosphatase